MYRFFERNFYTMKKILSVLLALVTLTVTACSGGAPAAGGGGVTAPAPANSVSGAADWENIKNKGELVIGVTYFEPMCYKNSDGTLTGFETDFANAVCENLGVKATFKEIDWNSKEMELNSKNIDCIWNGMTITDERKSTMSVSNPYMKNAQVLVTKKGNAETLGKSADKKIIVAETGSAGGDVVKGNDFFKDSEYIGVASMANAIMEVASGTADGCVIDYVASIGMIGAGTDYADLAVVSGREFADEEYGIAFRKGDTELTAKVNETINALAKEGKLEEIAAKYKLQERLVTI